MIKQVKILFFILVVTAVSLADEENGFPVKIDNVQVVGNEKTKSYIILREIPYQFPAELDKADLLIIKNRIQNLLLFNRVELIITQQGEKKQLLVLVTESWYFFPSPLLFINEHDWGKISFGLQLSHYNFRGRNEKLNLGGWLGYNPSFYINYFNPWIDPKLRLIFGAGVFKRRTENRIFDFEEKRFGFDITVGRKLSLNLDAHVQFTFQQVELPEEFREYSLSENGTDYVPSLSFQVKWDSRDLFEYPKKGVLLTYNFRKIGFTSKQPDFWRFVFDNRAYIPLYRGLSLGGRQLFIFNRGTMPIYDRVFLGFEERIRGYFTRVFPDPALFQTYTSNQISFTSFELRFPILPIRYFSIENGPIIPSVYRDLKFGISGGIFVDSGISWQDAAEVTGNNLFSGYGAGIHFHLPYAYIFRIDYAINDKGLGQWIIDAGVSF
jgi:outer membrane protein assembly factor BamA